MERRLRVFTFRLFQVSWRPRGASDLIARLFIWIGRRRAYFVAQFADFRHRHRVAGVAPTVANVGQHTGDLFIRQVVQRRHDAIVTLAVDDDLAATPQQHAAYVIFLSETGEEVRLGQRRNLAGQTLAFGLVANEAGLHIDALAFLDLDFFRQPGNFRVALDFLRNLRLQRRDFLFGVGTRLRRFAEIHGVHFFAGINEQVLRTIHSHHA